MTKQAESRIYATSCRGTVVRPGGIKAALRRQARNMILTLKSILDRREESTFLRCLACHYVFDDQRDEFRRLIRMLKNRGQFIDTDSCINILEGNDHIDGKYFHLSFDDGFKNVIQNAVPILDEEKVPMILFVPSDWVGADWETAQHYSIDIARYRQVVEMATWDELRQMVSVGFEIGSHTRTHVQLSTLSNDPRALSSELSDSKAEIERQLQRPCRYIAYPYGKPGDYDAITLEQTKLAGYRAGFGIHRGSIMPVGTNPYLVPRHHFEPEWPLLHVRYFANGNMEDYWDKKLAAADVALP